jgi:hypothetical protein
VLKLSRSLQKGGIALMSVSAAAAFALGFWFVAEAKDG